MPCGADKAVVIRQEVAGPAGRHGLRVSPGVDACAQGFVFQTVGARQAAAKRNQVLLTAQVNVRDEDDPVVGRARPGFGGVFAQFIDPEASAAANDGGAQEQADATAAAMATVRFDQGIEAVFGGGGAGLLANTAGKGSGLVEPVGQGL